VLESVLAEPRGVWFWASEQGKEAPGRQWWLGEDETAEVQFLLEIVNVGDADQAVRKRVGSPR
jgi:hypothetical protein